LNWSTGGQPRTAVSSIFGRLALPVLAVVLPLAACGPARNEFAPACPVAALVPALSDLTRFNGTGRDLTDLVLQARIVQVNGKCGAGSDSNTLAASVSISITIQRGPGMNGREADIPVFVAVALADDVLDKQMLPVHVVFPPNVDRVTLTSQPIDLAFPVDKSVSGPSYRVIAGFQLTPDEVEANRRSKGS
jgi:hypothetical protein